MVNLKDVAKEAGISIATVSRYVNKKGYISEELKALIKNAIEKTGYKPNLVARSITCK
ncbi:MAG: LacI family DNA-binding transcriptional regulator [Actinobacteria bacterium]|nr:LacI family DNA-binding transcriptional regulator [Actinomycetota bacterium]